MAIEPLADNPESIPRAAGGRFSRPARKKKKKGVYVGSISHLLFGLLPKVLVASSRPPRMDAVNQWLGEVVHYYVPHCSGFARVYHKRRKKSFGCSPSSMDTRSNKIARTLLVGRA